MLYISCQPTSNEDYYNSGFIVGMAKAAKLGGASGLRIEGIRNINVVADANIGLPIIGLVKTYDSKARITKITDNIADVYNLCQTRCLFIATECTMSTEKEEIKERIELIRSSGKASIADISTTDEAIRAFELGADYIATTLCGYRSDVNTPAFSVIKELATLEYRNLILEGSVFTHEHYIHALSIGAAIVVVGTAITRPDILTRNIIGDRLI